MIRNFINLAAAAVLGIILGVILLAALIIFVLGMNVVLEATLG